MLLDILYNDFSWITVVSSLIASVIVVFLTLPIHELAHGYTAYKLGDSTAKYQGRLSFNPLAHLDIWGTALIFLIGFGWAKPVPVNPRNFKNPKRDMAITALAGPLSNLIMAFIMLILAYTGLYYCVQTTNFTSDALAVVGFVCFYAAQINVALAVFNLIPVPPLDGSRILSAFLPDRTYYKLMQYERYFFFIIVAIAMGTNVVSTVTSAILKLISRLAMLPFPQWFGQYMYILDLV